MTLDISIKDVDNINRFILLANLGILNALKNKLISITEAEQSLYTPYTVDKLRELQVSNEVIHLIELGCELEDIQSLLPSQLEKSILDLIDKTNGLLKQSMPLVYTKWIQ